MNLNILSFNWHEPYLCLLSEIGHNFLIVEPELTTGNYRKWDLNMRGKPSNVNLITLDEATNKLDKGEFDLAIAHNIKDLVSLGTYIIPKILVFHNKLSTEIQLGNNNIRKDEYLKKIEPLLIGVKKVFISESKKRDWSLEGEVILPGLDVDKYGGYTGENRAILRVGNLIKERDLMMGFSDGEIILDKLPSITLGMNPNIRDSRISSGFDDLINNYRCQRVFLNTTKENYEDGYNLALLEAMAVGMPVVSTANKTSPVKDGINGYISNDIQYLKNRARQLLDDKNKAKIMGERARKTVRNKFPKCKFINSWEKCINETIYDFLRNTGISIENDAIPYKNKIRKNILIDYSAYPATTGFYLERAFRKKHNVISSGNTITNEIISEWNLENLNWPIKPLDIYRSLTGTLSETLNQLPNNWNPDFYLWVETGLNQVPSTKFSHLTVST